MSILIKNISARSNQNPVLTWKIGVYKKRHHDRMMSIWVSSGEEGEEEWHEFSYLFVILTSSVINCILLKTPFTLKFHSVSYHISIEVEQWTPYHGQKTC